MTSNVNKLFSLKIEDFSPNKYQFISLEEILGPGLN